jgi:SAM-dependent methyltransferase
MQAQAFYSRAAAFYGAGLRLNGYARAVSYIVAQLPCDPHAPLAILDAGCGTGLYTLALLRRFARAQVLAVDLNPAMTGRLRRNLQRQHLEPRAAICLRDVCAPLPAPPASFDLIVTGGVLEHVPLRPAVAHLARYLRPGGWFLNAPVRDNLWGAWVGAVSGFQPYPAAETCAAFVENGFVLVWVLRLSARYFPICLVKEAHLFRKGSSGGNG